MDITNAACKLCSRDDYETSYDQIILEKSNGSTFELNGPICAECLTQINNELSNRNKTLPK